MKRYWNIMFVVVALVMCGCEKSDSGSSSSSSSSGGAVDAGATRAYWSQMNAHFVSISDADADQLLVAAQRLDRLSTTGVDVKVIGACREVATLYRQMGDFRRDAFERGRQGLGLNPDRGRIEKLSAESNRIAKSLSEVETYVRDNYRD